MLKQEDVHAGATLAGVAPGVHVTVVAAIPLSDGALQLVYLRPSHNVGPMLVFSQSTRDLMAVIFPNGFYERPRYQHWRPPEAATFSYGYEIGPVDTGGYRTLRVYSSEMGGKPQTIIRHWLGDRFEMGN